MAKRLWWIPVALLVIAGGLVLGFRSIWYLPAEVERAPVACTEDVPALPRDTPLKVLVWNIQFSASRRFEFFYDGGTTVSVDDAVVRSTLDEIADLIRSEDPDLLILQEVDRNSRRTGFIDQHAGLLERLDLPCHTAAPYHKVPYVPHPSHEHMGRVDMNLSVFSRYRITSATRHQLPLLKEGLARRLFNLRRAALELRMPVDGGGELVVFDTHLSAFSHNDGTLEEQVEVLGRLVSREERWLLAGDFNALPPGDPPGRISAEGVYGAQSAVGPLFEAYQSPFPPRDEAEFRTYVPYGQTEPDRTIDYLFHSGVEVRDLRVLREAQPLSDHLPFTVELTIPSNF